MSFSSSSAGALQRVESRLVVEPEERGLSPVAHGQGGTEAGLGRGCHGMMSKSLVEQ